MLKKNGGITLIALVITIIVLLILAGVSIAMLSGDNGLLTRSTDAADKEALAGAKDVVTTEVASLVADSYESRYVDGVVASADTTAYVDTQLKNSTENKNINKMLKNYNCNFYYTAADSTTDPATKGTITIKLGKSKITAVGELDKGVVTWTWGSLTAEHTYDATLAQ